MKTPQQLLQQTLEVGECLLPDASPGGRTPYPTVFVHGLLGWGARDALYRAVPYWGLAAGDVLGYLNACGYDCRAASVGIISSAWDRACELYAELTGVVECLCAAGESGAIPAREVLKHKGVESVTQCDIDEQVTRMAEKHFPELCDSNNDPRAELMFDDGVAYMANCPAGSVDVVIVDSTDPVGPAEGLFNKDFYASCFRALKDDGILVQQSESPLAQLELIKAMRSEMGKAGFSTFKTLPFPQPCYPTGWWSVTLARKGQGFGFRDGDAAAKGFKTKYYNAHLHQGVLVAPPFVAEALGEAQG